MPETARHILHEGGGRCQIPFRHKPARNELGVSADRCPRSDIPKAPLAPQGFWYILFLGIAERPDLVALNPLARQATEGLVLILRVSVAYVG